jgi:HSP20 family protein
VTETNKLPFKLVNDFEEENTMTTITRWDPFRDMMSMRSTMDRMIENSLKGDYEQTTDWGLPLDVVEEDDGYTIKASIPGVKPEDIEVTFNKGMLTVKGELKDESETTKGQYHLRERRFGTFSRTISLPTSIRAEDIAADYQDGILSLHLPKAEEVKPKRISVQTGSTHKVIDTNNKN